MVVSRFLQRVFVVILMFVFIFSMKPMARADEGMWIFANPPLKQLKEKYNFEPTQAWFDHARLASARLNSGGSGSFVSANGLLFTNHHVARPLLAKLSTPERDLLKNGFYASTNADELKCPDLEINVLVSMENVTEQVKQAGQGAPDQKTSEARRKAEIARIEKSSNEQTGLRSDIIKLYEGGEYWLYRYKKYTDIRMVFAPEAQAAEFGGDYDNFTYPRYALDFAFLRVYENNKPVKLDHYFRWSRNGAQDGELIFVIGSPGSTDRLRTIAQLEYQRDHSNPMQLRTQTRRRDNLLRYSALGAEQSRRASDTISSINNGLKRLTGQQEGLLNAKLMQQKVAEENDLRKHVTENPQLQQAYGKAWDEMAEAYKIYTPMGKRIYFSNLNYSDLAKLAVQIALYSVETKKPNSERLSAFRDSALESLRFQLLSPAPIYGDMEEAVLADRFQELRDELGAEDPFVKAILQGREPKVVAAELVRGSKLADVATRKALLDGGSAAIEQSNDPLIVMARRLVPIISELERWSNENFEGRRTAAGEQVSQARFAVYGRSIAPDANFSVRFSFGVVKGYEVGTTLAPYKTTFGGLYARGLDFDNKEPFDVAPKILAAKPQVDMSTPVNFVYTADTIGGNSGSPVINRNGEIVGINFDSNVHRFVSRYIYTEQQGRAMGVHSAGIIQALRKIYNASALADELEAK